MKILFIECISPQNPWISLNTLFSHYLPLSPHSSSPSPGMLGWLPVKRNRGSCRLAQGGDAAALCVTQAAGCEHAAAGAVWLFHFFLWMGPQNIFSGRSLKWHQMPGCRQQNQILNNIQINTLSSEANHGWGGLLVIPQGQMGQRQLLLGVCSWVVLVVLLGRQERGSTLPNLSQQHQELEFPNKWHLSR